VFAAGDPPPREDCQLDVLIDGANALPEIAAAMARAKHSIHVSGWHIAPSFELDRTEPQRQIGVILAEMAERVDVRVLVWSGAPVPVFHPTRAEVREGIHDLVRGARELIYIENQFLWAPELVSIIADKLRHPPTPDFRVVILLPAKANNGADGTQGQLSVLADADDGQGRLLGATIRSLSPVEGRADPLYVHAKVCVVDDRWLIVGSANLNAHSFFNDTEACVVSDDAQLAPDTRVRLWAEHVELDENDVAGKSVRDLVDEHWLPIAGEQLARRQAGAPPTHRLLKLPGVSKRSRRLLGALSGLVDDG
jgi:phosphatidylserine/phosphatidylglycerophosphate/cardiolipin synthase-like enzyme